MPSKYGGIAVDESPAKSKYGGVAVSDDQPALSANSGPVDMSEKNTGTPKPDGQGFIAHATKTLRDLPDAFTSGRIVSGPLKSLGDSMGEYLSNPTLHNSIRAIPGVGMMEDAVSQPYRTGAGGDTAGAWGDGVELAVQGALGLRGRVPEPIRDIGDAPIRSPRNILPKIPQDAIDATHFIPGVGAPLRLGARAFNAAGKLINGAEVPPGGSDVPLNPRRAYDTSVPVGMRDQVQRTSRDHVPVWDGIRNARAMSSPDPQAEAFTPIRGTLPSGRSVGRFAAPQEAAILPQPLTMPEAGIKGVDPYSDMTDILQRSLDHVQAVKNGTAPPSEVSPISILKVRRRK